MIRRLLIMTYLPIIAPLLLTQTVSTQERNFTSSRGNPHGGAGGTIQMAKHISTTTDIAELFYRGTAHDMATDENRIYFLIATPRMFHGDGAYIWRNQEGIWNVSFVCKGNDRFSATISTSAEIEYDSKENSHVHLITQGSNKLVINDLQSSPADTVQFRTNALIIDCDFLINELRRPESVYLGNALVSPERIPFSIRVSLPNSRSDEKPVVFDKTQTIDDTQSSVLLRPDEKSVPRTNAAGGGVSR